MFSQQLKWIENAGNLYVQLLFVAQCHLVIPNALFVQCAISFKLNLSRLDMPIIPSLRARVEIPPVGPDLNQGWASVADAGPALIEIWSSVSRVRSLGRHVSDGHRPGHRDQSW